MNKSAIGGFLYGIGVSYYEFGVIKKGTKKVYDYFKTDSLTQQQKQDILKGIPNCVFKTASPQYAPELKSCLICIPVGKIPNNKKENEE